MIKTGILGTSTTADLYARILKNSDIFTLSGYYAPDPAHSGTFAFRKDLPSFPSAGSLFNSCEALIITDFAPHFLKHAEEAIKSFKHILITNPFLAGLEEIDHLRKLSEESGVFMQIAGGFRFQNLLPETENCLVADLKHSFGPGMNVWSTASVMEYILCHTAYLLSLLKGIPKKHSIHAWETHGVKSNLISCRIDLDNGSIANILLGDLGKSDHYILQLFQVEGVKSFESEHLSAELNKAEEAAVERELIHFEKSIHNRYLSSFHNDVMFQALELSHRIKEKAVRYSSVSYPD
jgi:hypothetical protein